MVTQVTSLSRSGVSDWLIQRVSAIVVALYTVVLLGWILLAGDVSYAAWRELFSSTWMQVFTLIALLATCGHAWVGMWTIGSDYLRSRTLGQGADALRYVYQIVCVLILLVYLVWGVKILWGSP
ncbi:MAG TPA: succinate dehydrogenase, hydrophobic membrane anchor protein [Gammaproteobacteria bacterium]|nr:succinate dehydrogenase, hydrophobic membrane anchor protein [Gammaproteobacteria bacterium]|tara:strand:- start:960 stop:1331 length:372 start_codon:yes stop_codon:yes gene_type:complete